MQAVAAGNGEMTEEYGIITCGSITEYWKQLIRVVKMKLVYRRSEGIILLISQICNR